MPNPYGAGNQNAGWTPAGAYYPVSAPPTYVPFPDPSTGLADSGRLIDQGTRQFVYDANGDPQGMGTVDQCVQIAWGTIQLQALVPTFSGGWEQQVQSVYTSAVQSLLSNTPPLLAIVSFTLTRFGQNGLTVAIKWKDLTTNVESTFKNTG
jgi:hypothetical protein